MDSTTKEDRCSPIIGRFRGRRIPHGIPHGG